MVRQSSRQYLLGILVVSLFVAVPGYAVENVKTSTYGAGHQIWFEVEDFDERDPADETSFTLSDQPGAFGRSISSVNGSDGSGMIRYDFDISKAGGSGGSWYFWGRVINPNNNSDFMLVDGHPGDQVPFTQPVSGLVNGQRIFEQSSLGNDWVWAPTEGSAGEEAHTKTLRDGMNTMYVISREAGAHWDVFMWTDDPDYIPTDEDYINATAPVSGTASNPSPASGAIDVPRDVTLGWTPGEDTVARDVYFGKAFSDVNAATRDNPMGALVSQGQVATTYELPAVLEFGQTYYWRIDEVNAAPDSTIFPGPIWNFTVEPYVYPIENITATASSATPEGGPENIINGSGMDADGLHSSDLADMWVSAPDGQQPTWIQFEFDQVYKLYDMTVWNYNVLFEMVLGYGFKDTTIEYSANGTDWTLLVDVEFAQAPSVGGYAGNTIVDMAGVSAQYVRLTANSNFGALPQYGLSEVRFTYVPVHPREPQPGDGDAGVSVDTVLGWRAGREAAAHEVYFGTDEAAVADGTALADTVTARMYDPAGLDLGQTYFWKIVEVNELETPSAWEGALWTFSTQEYFVVEDFESYDDEDNRIFDTWLDGFINETGSTVGYFEAPFAETSIVNSGRQSMPLEYVNDADPFYSETERTFDGRQDWTTNGADTLVVNFRGNPVAFVEQADGSIVIGAAGTDIWGTVDEFRFVYKDLTGDGSIVARVDSLEETDPWAKAGVMIRDTLDPGSKFAAVYMTAGNGCRYQAREASNLDATSDTSVATAEQMALTVPYWIKLERTGDDLNGFYSADGTTWTAMSWNPQTISMPGSIHVGLAVTSHSPGNPTVAELSNMTTTGNVTGAWQMATIGVEQPSNEPGQLYVAVEDAAGHLSVITHPDPEATVLAEWQQWQIPLSEFAGVNMASVERMYIGIGDRDNPQAGGSGLLFIDDIGVGHPADQ